MTDWAWPDSTIARVIDGDSIDANVTRTVDIGFEATSTVTFPVRLRLNRINTSPAKKATGPLATARVQALTTGVKVGIVTKRGYKYGAPENKTGEWMAEVALPDGRNLSDLLVAEGLAVYWSGQGPRPDGI